jgi:hypothetical protein
MLRADNVEAQVNVLKEADIADQLPICIKILDDIIVQEGLK